MKEYKVEPLDLMQYINTHYHEPFIHLYIEFFDSIDEERLKNSILKLVEAFPLLKCFFDKENNKFKENDNFNIDSIFKVDNQTNKDILLTQSLDSNKKLVLFTLSSNYLVITISHLVCDGSGFKKLIYLLCDFYNEKEVNYSSIMNRDFSIIEENIKGKKSIIFKMIFSMMNNYKNTKIYNKVVKEDVHLLERTIPNEIMKIVHEKAKERGATINDVFLTAYAITLSKFTGKKKINIPCTVDLRKYAPNKAGIANFTGSYALNIKINNKDNFWKNLNKVSRKMKKQKRGKNDIVGPILLVQNYNKLTLNGFIKMYGQMDTSPFVDYTNLGILDDKILTFKNTKIKNAICYSCLNKAPYFSIAISSFKDRTTISALILCGEKVKEKIDIVLDNIKEEVINSLDNL